MALTFLLVLCCPKMIRRLSDLALCVGSGPLELEADELLVALYPGIVTRCDAISLTRRQRDLRAVLVFHAQMARSHVSNMVGLAGFGAGNRLDALRPAPAGLECESTYFCVA